LGDDGAVEDDSSRQPAAWAAPGVAVDQPEPRPLGGPDGGDSSRDRVVDDQGSGAAAADGDGAPTITLRPMTVADILDGGFAVVKARPKRILGLTAAFVVPTQLAVALLQRDVVTDGSLVEFLSSDPTVQDEPVTGGDLAAQWVALGINLIVPAIALVCIAAALGHLVGQWVMGRDAPAGELAGVIGRRWWALLASFVVVKLAEAGSLFGCYVGILFVMPLFVVVAPAIGVEGVTGMAALGRSVSLVRHRYFPVMGIAVLMGLVSFLLTTALSALPQAIVGWSGEWWPLLTVGNIVATTVTMPFVAAATVLLYFDLRVRSEGLDIEMAAGRVFDRAA
jgi:hypothetical protein